MASTRRKSAAIALAVIGVAGLSLAAAAQLDVGSSSLGAATTVVASCQPVDADGTNGIKAAFTTAYVAGVNGQYDVTGVGLTGVAAGCDNLSVKVTLTNAAGAALGTATGTASAGATTLTLSGSPTIHAAEVTGVAIVIGG